MENKAARLRDRAANVSAKGEAAYAASNRIANMIPMGQPILIGHHSERRHRRQASAGAFEHAVRVMREASEGAAQ
jgi:triosephosphate isomerase